MKRRYRKTNPAKWRYEGAKSLRRLHDQRGSSEARRVRKKWILTTFGDGTTCKCTYCPKKLTFKTLQVDRKLPGFMGGTYRRDNCLPSCKECNIMRYHKEGHGTSVGFREGHGPATNPRRYRWWRRNPRSRRMYVRFTRRSARRNCGCRHR